MNPTSVLLDLTFLAAVTDIGDANHDEAVAIYRTLVDDFVEQRHLVVARADHLAAIPDADLFAAVDKLHVAGQHRHAAHELIARTALDVDEAITLVLIRRLKIRKVATFDERLASYDINIITSIAPAHSNAEVTSG